MPGYGPTAGAAISHHMDVDKVAFTGSTQVFPAPSAVNNCKKQISKLLILTNDLLPDRLCVTALTFSGLELVKQCQCNDLWVIISPSDTSMQCLS